MNGLELDDQTFHSITYREQESPEYCVVDAAMRIALSNAPTAIPSAFRVSYWVCEEEAADHAQEREDILNSFRITTEPSQYYMQALIVNSVLIKATGKVDPKVMYFAADIVKWTLGGRQDIVDCIANAGSSIAVIPKDEYITTLPDLAYLKEGTDHIGRTYHSFEIRGTGATKDSRLSTFGEETLEGISPQKSGREPRFSPSRRFLNVDCRCNSGFLTRITYIIMPYKTGIRLPGVARNLANGFPARLLGHWNNRS